MVHTIQYEGNGGWVQSPGGRVWVSAKHAGSKMIDLQRVCFGALLPPDMEKAPFCTGSAKCKHSMPGGYSFVCDFTRALRNDELITKRPREEQQQYTRSSRGRGGRQQNQYNLQADDSWWNGRGSGGRGSWGAQGDYGAKGNWGSKGDGGQKGGWGGKGEWSAKGSWGAKGDWNGKGAWGAKGEWNVKPEWGAKGEWSAGEKGKGKGRGKGEGSWGNDSWAR